MNKFIVLFSGLIMGIAIGSGFVKGYYEVNQNLKLIEQCEADLPRNQRCILIAVPESEDG